MSTIHITLESRLSAEQVLAAASDFSERRERIFPAVCEEHMVVHRLGEVSADVTEGTRTGPMFNWERCTYDWSHPGIVRAEVTDSNVYDVEPSGWELRALPRPGGGSRVEMIWEREFVGSAKGRLLGVVFRRAGNRLFGSYAQEILDNLEAEAA